MLVTTSRRPSLYVRNLARDLAKSVPKAEYAGRADKPFTILSKKARYNGHEKMLVIESFQGKPSGITVLDLLPEGYKHVAFITLGKTLLRKEVSSFNEKIDSLSVKTREKQFTEALSIESEKNSPFSLKDKSRRTLSFFKGIQEIGPRIALKGVENG